MLSTYENFRDNQTVVYGSQATSASVNKAPLFLKTELDNVNNYMKLKFGEEPQAWSATHAYLVGELCFLNGVIYRALVNNINDEPNSANWEIVDVLKSWEAALAWVSTTNYAQYDVVTHNGDIYESLSNNLNSEPPSVDWNLIGSVGQNSMSGNFIKTDGDSAPDADSAYNIGTASLKFSNIYADILHGDIDGGNF